MKKLAFCICVLGLSALLAGRGLSGDDKDLRAIIKKGIEAQGGVDNIGKFESAVVKGAGKFYGLGEGIPFSGVFTHEGMKKMRVDMDLNLAGKEIKVIVVVNGDKG